MFSLKESNRRMFSRNVMAKLSISALFGALCVLPACSINAHDKQKARMAKRTLTSSLPWVICTSASKPISATPA